MLNIFTVGFFGHREIENLAELENQLDKLLYELIVQKDFVEFLIGREGEFDIYASSIIKKAIRNYGNGNASLVLVLPYMKAEYRNNMQNYHDYYDEVRICNESARTHYKSAIQIRNKYIIDNSDLAVCYIRHKYGGAYNTIKYAVRQGKEIKNLSREDIRF